MVLNLARYYSKSNYPTSWPYRHYYHGQWDLESNKRVQFEGLRSGCWLGMIPAGGVLLAPEASAGCSCANAIQTSIGYVPKHLDPSAFSVNNPL